MSYSSSGVVPIHCYLILHKYGKIQWSNPLPTGGSPLSDVIVIPVTMPDDESTQSPSVPKCYGITSYHLEGLSARYPPSSTMAASR